MLLLAAIYIAFIGLGLPDSLFGTAWPAIYQGWSLPFSWGSFVAALNFGCTMLSSLMSARLINRFGTGLVTACSTALTAAALGLYALSGNFAALCLLAVPLGLGAGAVDTGLNNYVALHYSARQMSFLHCFYGVGIVVSPYILSLVMHGPEGWRAGYRAVFAVQAAITLLLFAALPLWNRGGENGAEEETARDVPLREVARIPGVPLMWVLFFTSCAVESCCNALGSTFLVEHRGMAADAAARIMIFYFAGYTLGRLTSGLIADRLPAWTIARAGRVILAAGLLTLATPGRAALAAAGFFLVGFGVGPQFPNFSYLTPILFGKDVSASVIGAQMAVANLSFITAPVVCSFLCQALGIRFFPFWLLLMLVCMLLASTRAGRLFGLSGGRQK